PALQVVLYAFRYCDDGIQLIDMVFEAIQPYSVIGLYQGDAVLFSVFECRVFGRSRMEMDEVECNIHILYAFECLICIGKVCGDCVYAFCFHALLETSRLQYNMGGAALLFHIYCRSIDVLVQAAHRRIDRKSTRLNSSHV